MKSMNALEQQLDEASINTHAKVDQAVLDDLMNESSRSSYHALYNKGQGSF